MMQPNCNGHLLRSPLSPSEKQQSCQCGNSSKWMMVTKVKPAASYVWPSCLEGEKQALYFTASQLYSIQCISLCLLSMWENIIKTKRMMMKHVICQT